MASRLPIPLILASTSPRRIDLMRQVGLEVEVKSPNADETPKLRERPERLVQRLSLAKAASMRVWAESNFEKSLIVAADTIVVAPGGKKILGKPRDVKEAKSMLKLLAGKTHLVLTGYCLLSVSRKDKDRRIVRVVRSKVKMRPLSAEVIEKYVQTGEPMDKAGSYAAQGLGVALVEGIHGSYTNVVGLPISHVIQDIEKLLGVSLFAWKD
jgi:septum formation protein